MIIKKSFMILLRLLRIMQSFSFQFTFSFLSIRITYVINVVIRQQTLKRKICFNCKDLLVAKWKNKSIKSLKFLHSLTPSYTYRNTQKKIITFNI